MYETTMKCHLHLPHIMFDIHETDSSHRGFNYRRPLRSVSNGTQKSKELSPPTWWPRERTSGCLKYLLCNEKAGRSPFQKIPMCLLLFLSSSQMHIKSSTIATALLWSTDYLQPISNLMVSFTATSVFRHSASRAWMVRMASGDPTQRNSFLLTCFNVLMGNGRQCGCWLGEQYRSTRCLSRC